MDRISEMDRERLRAIRSLAILKDRAALDQQVRHLDALDEIDEAYRRAVADAIEQEAYGTVVALMEMVLAESTAPAHVESQPAEDDESVLQARVNHLEQQLSALEQEEAELQRAIRSFNVRYRDELGPLVAKLLRLRKERLEQSLYARRADAHRRTAFNQAESQFEQFQSVLENAPEEPMSEVSEEDQARLKAAYRRATKRCHPDMVDAAMEDEARTYFNALREAYQRNDVARVEAIADVLEESGFAQRSAAPRGDQAQLEARAERLRRRIATVEDALDALRATKAHQVMTRTDDLDAYFDTLKQKLRREMRQLRPGRPTSRRGP